MTPAARGNRERSRIRATLCAGCHVLPLPRRSRLERRLRADRHRRCGLAKTARSDWDSDDPTVLALAGFSLGFLAEEHDLALSLTERALTLNPNSATALQLGGWVRLLAGDPDTAMVYFLRGTRLNPIDTKRFILDSGLARASLMLGRYEEAIGLGAQIAGQRSALGSSRQSLWQVPWRCSVGCEEAQVAALAVTGTNSSLQNPSRSKSAQARPSYATRLAARACLGRTAAVMPFQSRVLWHRRELRCHHLPHHELLHFAGYRHRIAVHEPHVARDLEVRDAARGRMP